MPERENQPSSVLAEKAKKKIAYMRSLRPNRSNRNRYGTETVILEDEQYNTYTASDLNQELMRTQRNIAVTAVLVETFLAASVTSLINAETNSQDLTTIIPNLIYYITSVPPLLFLWTNGFNLLDQRTNLLNAAERKKLPVTGTVFKQIQNIERLPEN